VPLALVLACVWAVLGCIAGMMPQRFHWAAAWILIATGIPILGSVTWQAGPVWGVVCLLAGASILRWPVLRAAQKVRRILLRAEPDR